MCSLCFENNLLSIEGVCFASISTKNTIIEVFVRFRFASVAITSQHTKVEPVQAADPFCGANLSQSPRLYGIRLSTAPARHSRRCAGCVSLLWREPRSER
jgi:hypothetical protein